MRRKYKEIHEEKAALERLESLNTLYGAIDIVRVCAKNSTNFEEFVENLVVALQKIEDKM